MKTEEFINKGSMYRTADLSLSTVIFMSFPLEAIDKRNARKAYFIFKSSPELLEIVEQYWKGELKVEPQAYFNALRIIKARLYGEG